MNYRFWIPLFVACLFGMTSASALELLAPNDKFPDFNAKDQHDNAYEFTPGTRTVMIAFDMSAGKQANKVLADLGADYLPQHQAVFVSNIYGMPGVGRFFALPKMKKYPHRIVLADEVGLLAPFPKQEGHVTVIQLNDDAVVQSIRFWNPKTEPIQDYLP